MTTQEWNDKRTKIKHVEESVQQFARYLTNSELDAIENILRRLNYRKKYSDRGIGAFPDDRFYQNYKEFKRRAR